MNIVTQTSENNMSQTLGDVPQIPMLQARLAKDGTDDDIKMAFRDVSDKTARLKSLVRLGIQMEQGGVLKENDYLIFDGEDLVSVFSGIVAQIGSSRIVL